MQSVVLAWDANSDELTTGYFLHAEDSTGNPISKSDVGSSTSASVDGLVNGATYVFHVTAYTASGLESDSSNEVTYQVPVENAAPTADPKSLQTKLNQALPVVLSGSDPNGDPIAFSVAALPQHGSLSGAAPNLTYTPAQGFVGIDTFTYVATDGKLTSIAAQVTITVQDVNRAPAAVALSLQTMEGQAVSVTLRGSDPDGDALSFRVSANPAHGVLSGVTPNLVYTPTAGFAGTDSFTYYASDGRAVSASATVAISVVSVNQAPTAISKSYQALQGQPVSVILTGMDPDGDALLFSIRSGPSHGTLSGTPPNLTYVSANNYSGVDSFTFVVKDGSMAFAEGTISISVSGNNGRIKARRK